MKKQYFLILITGFIFTSAIGVVAPFLNLFIIKYIGEQYYSCMVGTLIAASAVAPVIVGNISDKANREKLLAFSYLGVGITMLGYMIGTNISFVYILQALIGFFSASETTLAMSILGDLSREENRGSHIGLYNTITGIAVAIMVFLGGFLINYNFYVLFLISSFFMIAAACLLFLFSTYFLV